MGNQQAVQYSRYIEGSEKPGYSREIISTLVEDESKLVDRPAPEVTTMLKAFERSVRRFPNHNYLGTRDETQEGRPYKWRTWREVDELTDKLSQAYFELSLTPTIKAEGKDWKFMGVYAKNREEWILTTIANMKNSIATVAFYDTLGPAAVEFVIRQTELTTISCAGQYVAGLIKLKKDGKAQSLQNIITFDKVTEEVASQAQEVGITLREFWDVVKIGEDIGKKHQLEEPGPNTVYMFSYTSGTTGDPKAAILEHRNYIAAASGGMVEVPNLSENTCYISYLPLAHSLEQAMFTVGLINGCKYGFYSGDPLKLMDDMQALQPTIFASVPRLFTRIYDKIMAGVKAQSGTKQWLFNKALASKLYYLENQNAFTHKVYDTIVFNKLKNLLGGKVELMITGSAPIAGDVLNTLKVIFSCPIREGYGQTETSAPATITWGSDPTAGHVGGPIAACKIRLRDIPEMEYFHTDPNPRGEVCFKGHNVFRGYFKAEDKTREAFDEDGWLRSGDVGMILPNGAIKIIDRAKNIFKLSQGEYIAPEKLENVYVQSPFIQQIFVYGDSLQNYIVAIVVVEPATVKKWAQDNGLDGENLAPLMQDEKLEKAILADMNKLATENKFNSLEKIKHVHLTLDLFTQENDLLTPTMKIKRNIAKKVFEAEIANLYARPVGGAN